jgi:hypothetical protein
MGRSIIGRMLVLLLFAALLAPVLEAFDHWDSTPGLASDTEFHVATLAIAAGLLAAVALVAVRASRPLVSCSGRLHHAPRAARRTASPRIFFSSESPPVPPLPLRI